MKRTLLAAVALLMLLIRAEAGVEILPYRLSSANGGLPNDNIRTIEASPDGMLYFSSHYNTYSFDGYSFREVPFHKPRVRKGERTDNLGNKVRVDADGYLYYKYGMKTGFKARVFSPQMLKVSSDVKMSVVTDIRNLVWVSIAGNGVFVFDKTGRQLRHITRDDPERLIESNYIVAMAQDRAGNIYVSQEHQGLVCLKVTEADYRVVPVNAANERTADIRMMQRVGNGRIVLCNSAGELYEADGRLSHLRLVASGTKYLTAATDRQGHLLLGSRQDGMKVGDKWMCRGRIESIVEDKAGHIWATGLHNGLYADGRLVLPDGGFRQLRIDGRGTMYLAGDSGVIRFNPDKLLRSATAFERVFSGMARCLYIGQHGKLYIGTPNSGIHVLDGKRTDIKSQHITRNEGLPSNAITFITAKDGIMVIGTEGGLCSWDGRTFHLLAPVNNPLNNFCNENSFAFTDDGCVAVGTLKGVVVASMAPQHAPAKGSRPQAAVTALVVDGNMAENFAYGNDIELTYDENNLTFHFSTFDYTQRGITDYSFRLDGYDNGWQEATRHNTATYRNLAPGTYRFHLCHRDAAGQWVESPVVQTVTVSAPLWTTWWAICAYVIAVAAIVAVVGRQMLVTYRLRRDLAIEQQLTEYKLRFFTDISHEFRTPLTLIQAAMDKLGALADSVPSTVRMPIGNMQRSVDRMMRLVNQLMEFRKMQNGKLTLGLQQTDIVAFVHNIWISFIEQAENRRIQYDFLPQWKSLDAYIDRGHVDKIVYNLLSNAFKYTPSGGRISLRLRGEGSRLQITVADTGIGIDEERRTHIFERYTTGRVAADSIGIGLHLTFELVKVHHGTIDCHPNDSGGTVFTVTLPADKAEYADAEFLRTVPDLSGDAKVERKGFEQQAMEIAHEPMNDRRVLVVDDTPELCAMLAKELGRYFFVETAADGKEALDRIKSADKGFDLVISDVRMPQMDGYELTRRLRADKSTQSLPVVLLTSLTDEEKQTKGFDAGADAYVTKPFNMDVLIAQCAALLRQRETLKSAYATASGTEQKAKVRKVIREEKDLKFIVRLDGAINSRLADTTLNVDSLAEMFGMGRTTFYTKVRTLTGKTPNEYITDRRLSTAADMLAENDLSVAEVAYKCGFNTPQYFSGCFKKRFGLSPKDYANGKQA